MLYEFNLAVGSQFEMTLQWPSGSRSTGLGPKFEATVLLMRWY
jgi:hypothetical protein